MKKIIIIVLSLILLTSCTKTEISSSEFVEVATFNGYIITSSMDGYEKYDYINNVIYAINRENAYFIQFIEIMDDDYAKKFFDINKQEIEKNKTNNSNIKKINKSDYGLYHIENDDDYQLVMRIRNNIIYIDAPINYINEIEEFLNELNIDY